jgi:hypothetical protein
MIPFLKGSDWDSKHIAWPSTAVGRAAVASIDTCMAVVVQDNQCQRRAM